MTVKTQLIINTYTHNFPSLLKVVQWILIHEVSHYYHIENTHIYILLCTGMIVTCHEFFVCDESH